MTKDVENQQREFIHKMTSNLPVLRASVGLTQRNLSEKIGLSRQTVAAYETEKRDMTWSAYLALVCVFTQYESANKLMRHLGVFDPAFLENAL